MRGSWVASATTSASHLPSRGLEPLAGVDDLGVPPERQRVHERSARGAALHDAEVDARRRPVAHGRDRVAWIVQTEVAGEVVERARGHGDEHGVVPRATAAAALSVPSPPAAPTTRASLSARTSRGRRPRRGGRSAPPAGRRGGVGRIVGPRRPGVGLTAIGSRRRRPATAAGRGRGRGAGAPSGPRRAGEAARLAAATTRRPRAPRSRRRRPAARRRTTGEPIGRRTRRSPARTHRAGRVSRRGARRRSPRRRPPPPRPGIGRCAPRPSPRRARSARRRPRPTEDGGFGQVGDADGRRVVVPRRRSGARSTSTFLATTAGSPKRLQASACRAARRSVRCSPEPPTRSGTRSCRGRG